MFKDINLLPTAECITACTTNKEVWFNCPTCVTMSEAWFSLHTWVVMALQVSSANDIKVYNISTGKSLPEVN